MLDAHCFADNYIGYVHCNPIKNIIEDCGAFTITNTKLLNRLSGNDFNFTGTAYFHPTPTLLKDLIYANAHLYVYGHPVTIECYNNNGENIYKGTYIVINRGTQNTGNCSLIQLANRVQIAGVFNNGKLSYILT